MTMTSIKAKAAHPTAKALFAAFEQDHGQDSDGMGNFSDAKTRTKSDLIRRRTQSLGWRSRHSQAELYPVTVGGNSFSVKQVQRGEVEGTYGTGATVWPASIVLIKYLEKHPSIVQNKSVVELGAGTGVASIAAAYLGAKEVVCTDGIESVVDLAAQNVVTADIDCPISTLKYRWGEGSLDRRFDVVLVSDCVLPKLYPIEPLVDALDELMSDRSVAFVSYEHRYFSQFHPGQRFTHLCRDAGLLVREIDLHEQDMLYAVDDIVLWELRRTPL